MATGEVAKYHVDFVLCIDASADMDHLIEAVKVRVSKFPTDVVAFMQTQGKLINTLRAKVIVFRDCYADKYDAMGESSFFKLPQEEKAFVSFLQSTTVSGGGNKADSGLEALALAIRSDWTTIGDLRRYIIALWTSAPAHALEKNLGSKPNNYPEGIPTDFEGLTDMWEERWFVGSLHRWYKFKRLVLFAPDTYPWSDIAFQWSGTIHHAAKAGEGLDGNDYQTILRAIASSFAS